MNTPRVITPTTPLAPLTIPRGPRTRPIHAEWTKLRTSPGTIWLVLGIVVATIGISAAATAAVGCASGLCTVDTVRLSLTGVQLGQAVVAVLAVLAIGTEYSCGMIGVSLAAMPRRGGVLAAKAVVVTGVVVAASAVAVLGCLVVGRVVLPAHPSLSPAEIRAAFGSVLYLALVGLLSLGTATAVRNSAAAVGIVIGLLFVFPILIQAATDPAWQRHLRQIGPMTAGLGIQATTNLDQLPLTPWQGLGVLAAWAAGALLVGGLLLRCRDA
jgi:ABC-2 type transport system permease protein